MRRATRETLGQLRNGLRLVTGDGERETEIEARHVDSAAHENGASRHVLELHGEINFERNSHRRGAEGAELNINEITSGVIGAAIHVHRELGPGLLESAYEACLAYELTRRGFNIELQKSVPLTYQGVNLECGYRLDMVVESSVIVELKAVERLDPVHTATVLTYLRLMHLQVALLINFNVTLLKNGVHRIVLNYRDPQMSSASSAPLR